jgi:hypothetical protein
MEYEDYYHPIVQETTLQSKNMLNEIKSMDKGYHKFKRNIPTPNGTKKITVELYSSGDTGSNIRDAITGQFYSCKVGSRDEDNFFKAVIATGEIKSDRRNFFFSSPTDYERMFHTTLDEKIKYIHSKN